MQRRHLSETFVNLLQNAREALGEQRQCLRQRRLPRAIIPSRSPSATTAPGIPPDKLERIFEAYYTTKEKGTGLGLAIVKHNVELYGGTVRVESELGKGRAKFHAHNASRRKSLMRTQPACRRDSPLPPVLVVDDEKNMRLSLQDGAGGRGLRRAGG